MRNIWLGLVFVAGLTSASAAQDLVNLKREISGGDQGRKWTVKDVVVFKGAAGGCAAGDVYRFRPDNTLTHTWCENRRLRSVQQRWSIGTDTEGQSTIKIDSLVYFVELRAGNISHLRLQYTPSDTKTAIITEIRMTAPARR